MENSRELLLLVDAVAKEKGLPKHEIFSFLAEGIETALRKNFPEGAIVHVEMDEQTGNINAWRLYELVDQIENVEGQMLHSEVEGEEVSEGYVWEKFDFKLNRQQFNITKQVALQRIKAQSRDQQIQELLNKPVGVYLGVVKVIKKDYLIVDCSGLDIIIYKRNLLPRETYKISEKIFFTLEKDKNNYVGTRTSEKYLQEVLKREIVQIEGGDIEIVACARNPGMRSKVIVRSVNGKFDPVKTCIGPKGSHIKNVQLFLNGESIDIIGYVEDPAQMLIKAIAPVNVSKIVMDEDNKTMEIAVDSQEIAQAIGRSGKNIEMIGQLIGWKIEVFSNEQWEEKESNADLGTVRQFMYALDCDEELAQYLAVQGFSSVEEIAYLSAEELQLDELDEETVQALKNNAREALDDESKIRTSRALQTLFTFGFDQDEVEKLVANQVYTNSDIADLSSYDLIDILPEIDTAKAQRIIMKARALQEKENAN